MYKAMHSISAAVLSGKRPHPTLTVLLFSSVAQSFPASLLLTLRYPTGTDTAPERQMKPEHTTIQLETICSLDLTLGNRTYRCVSMCYYKAQNKKLCV